jgi:UDP-glucose 4-epimerase
MRILVTGGSGTIGSHLAGVLLEAGHAVRVLDLAPARCGPPAAPGCDLVQGTIADRDLVARAMGDVEMVHHLAWGFHPGDERREIQENLFGTLNLLEAALAAGVRHFLFASSAVVYGPTGPTRVGEGHPCHPERSTIGGPVYGLAKLACEKLCLVYQRRGLPATILRLHGVFGAGHLGQFGPMIGQALSGEPVRAVREAGGEYARLEDVGQAFLHAMGHPQALGEVFNLGGTHTYQDPELARFVVERAGSRSRIDLVEDPGQATISVRGDKLRATLGIEPKGGEFLTALIERELEARLDG